MTEARRCERCGGGVPADAPGGECPRCLLEAGLDTQDTAAASCPPPAGIEELNDIFPGLEVEALIGQGGMGWVYRARQRSLDRTVALKILPRDVADDPAFQERFNREARALARLDHQNIISVHECGEAKGLYFFLMEYVDGINLRQAQKQGRLSPRETLAVVAQICDALQYAHDQGIVHRDIKPENILISRDGRVKIADFGLAKLLRPLPGDITLTGAGQVMGTYHYMAPEQIRTPRDVDHRADIYSLGVVFYEMLTGELPLGRFPAPSETVQVDVRLDRVVLRALEQERERRYQRAEEVKTDVHGIGSSGSVPAPPRKNGVPASGRRLSYLAVTGILLLPAALLAVLVMNPFVRRDETAVLFGVAVATFGLVFSALGWRAIRANPHMLGGLKIAKAGVFIPLSLALLYVLMAIPAYLIWRNSAALSRESAQEARERAEMHASIAKHLEWIDIARDFEERLRAADPRQRDWLRSLPEEERNRLAASGELGLAFIDPDSLPAPLTRFMINRYQRSGDGMIITAGAGDEPLVFPAVLVDGEWYLGVGQVERHQGDRQ